MEIILKNIKIIPSLSEETTCYSAVVYVDGKKAFDAKNRGNGGPDDYYPVANYKGPSVEEIDQWLCENKEPIKTYGMVLKQDLELYVSTLLEQDAQKKERDRFIKKLKTQIMTITPEKKITQFKKNLPPTSINIARVCVQYPSDLIINNNPDALEQAFRILVGELEPS